MTPPAKLLNRNFLLLWQGQFVSQLGSQAFAIAMMFWIKHETGSATLMGMLMMASTIPSVLLGPVAGTFADHHSRKLIIVWCDILNGLAVLTLAGLLFLAPDNTDLAIVWLFIVSVFLMTVSAFFRPAISAAIPDLVPTDKVAGANSMNQFSMQLSTFLGQGAGGVLFRLLGAPMLFLIDGLSYLFSAFSEAFITIPQTIPEKTKGLKASFERFKHDTMDGVRFVGKSSGLKTMFTVAAFLNFLLIPMIVLLPFLVEDHLHATTDWYGFMLAGFGVGAMAGFVVAGTVKFRGRTRSTLVIIALVIMSAIVASIGFTGSAKTAVGLFVAMGVVNGFININISTIIQVTTPSEIRGRVMGLLGTLSAGLAPIAMGLSGVVADLVDQDIPLIIKVSAGAATRLSIAVAVNRNFRDFLAYEPPATTDAATATAEDPQSNQ